MEPRDALGLLDRKLVDPRVRAYAVRCLRRLPDNELEDLLLQMIQVLRYEPHHFSALACFLLERAHKNRIQIGASLYWHAKAELDCASAGEAHRYLLLLDAYLRGCGSEVRASRRCEVRGADFASLPHRWRSCSRRRRSSVCSSCAH